MQETRMFDSEPKSREGEPIEALVSEAITVTASTATGRRGQAGGPRSETGYVAAETFLLVAAIAALEAAALLFLVLLWAIG